MTTTQLPHDTERARQLEALRVQFVAEAMRTARESRRKEGDRPRRRESRWWEFFTLPHA